MPLDLHSSARDSWTVGPNHSPVNATHIAIVTWFVHIAAFFVPVRTYGFAVQLRSRYALVHDWYTKIGDLEVQLEAYLMPISSHITSIEFTVRFQMMRRFNFKRYIEPVYNGTSYQVRTGMSRPPSVPNFGDLANCVPVPRSRTGAYPDPCDYAYSP